MGKKTTFAVSIVSVALLLMGALGCSFSNSSASISDSITNSSNSLNSISKSLSDSSNSSSGSSGGESDQAYRNDVSDYTYAYLHSGGGFDAFQKGLGDLAQRHGITDWEASQATFRAIGEGLAKAGATRPQLDVFKTNLAGSSSEMRKAMQEGYDSVS